MIEADTFTIVSGLPRSGTSLMMQMLKAGGANIMTDHERIPDQDNPEGYFEWEEIKRLAENPDVLTQASGKAVKVICALIPALPATHRYRVIFMDRPMAEVVASQSKMIDRRQTCGSNLSSDQLGATLTQHRDRIIRHLKNSAKFALLEINYPELIVEPASCAHRINDFLGGGLNCAAMAACVKPSLYRNRTAPVMPTVRD